MNRRAVVPRSRGTESLNDDPAAISDYLNEALSANSPGLFLAAIGDVVRARGVEKIASTIGLDTDTLLGLVTPSVNPEFVIVHEIVRALGVELAVGPGRN
ncbi:hypothetical protein [Burkholderia anthina]|uniref:helix-turn-helix domain-containing transcriptional regulator n=1 Tax=Burkholderia anthina TaxID=179879 RepID=UPI00158EF2FF